MYTCNHCKKKFNNIPFMCSNNKKYCSMECIPSFVMDKPYSFEYFNLVESIRDIESRIDDIKYFTDRIELENEVMYQYSKYILDMCGDDEGIYYKRTIYNLLPTFHTIYNKIHNIFIERNPETRPAIIIYWDNLAMIVGQEITLNIFECLDEKIKNIPFQNVWVGYDDYTNSMDINNTRDKLCVDSLTTANKIRKLFLKSLNQYKKSLSEKQLSNLECESYCVSTKKLRHCVVCGEWEDPDDFSFSDNLNLHMCNQWWKCSESEYDDLYQDSDEWVQPYV